jgi:hypothetical protein
MSNKVSVKPCKFCQDVGKPESECTNHRVKDLNGNTTCPTLLNTECRYCFNLGHTTKYCDVLAKHNKEKERIERRNQVVSLVAVVKTKKPDTAFAGLHNDSDSEEDVHNTTVDISKYSYLTMPNKKPKEDEKTTWVAIVSKPKEAPKPKPKVVQQPQLATWATTSQIAIKKSWADWSDSEDEDEY